MRGARIAVCVPHRARAAQTRAQHDRSAHRSRLTSARPPRRSDDGSAKGGAARAPALERVTDLYRGLTPALLGVVPVSLVYMPVYELASAAATAFLPAAYQPIGRVLAGSLAGLACSVVHTPITNLKNRLQLAQYADVRAAARAIASAEGLAGFYRGWTSEATLEILSATIQFCALDRLRSVARALSPAGEALPPWRNSLVGCAAGAITALCTEPFDVVKTRLTTQPLHRAQATRAAPGAAGARAPADEYRGVRGTLRQIARAEGAPALWRGLVPRVAYTGLKGAVWYSSYEWARAALRGAAAARR